jgi:phosphoribosyl 1,2-cyclic phosphodiesterase
VRAGRTAILIDIGLSAREAARRLALVGAEPEDLSAIVITHEHSDHVAGAAVASRRWGVPLLCRRAVARAARFAARDAGPREELPAGPFALGDLQVTPFPVQHDAVDTVGLTLEGEGIRAGYVTDLGCSTPEVEERLEDCHILAVEANHDVDMTREGPYPWHLKERILGTHGHLSNEAAADILSRVIGPETQMVLLAHISETNNTPELALVAARAGVERSRQPRVRVTAAEQRRPSAPIRL